MSPVWVNQRNKLEFLLQTDSNQSLQITRGCKRPSILVCPLSGAGHLQSDGYYHATLPFIESGLDGPPQMTLPGGHGTPYGLESSEHEPRLSEVQQLWLSRPGHRLAVWLWQSKSSSQVGRVLLFVHGGPHLHESAQWEPLRYAFLRSGYLELALDYGGSSGYGSEYESKTDLDDQAADLLAAVQFLVRSQGVSTQHIGIMASSYGTQVLLRALTLDPRICGLVIFAPFLGTADPIDSAFRIPFNGKVIAFHGHNDPISDPQSALFALRQLFPDAVSRGDFYWREFAHEGHGFNRVSSLQEVYGTTMCAAQSNLCQDLTNKKSATPKTVGR